ncbi:MAG TPA: LirA/MavJ family T4SS effector [Pseudomonas sp.]|nr:LirA/MavJ family T4SS effector [Pseudomonas sp.]
MPGYKILKEQDYVLTFKEKGKERKRTKQKDSDFENDLVDYGKIFDLLEDKPRFEQGIANLSKDLWDHYRRITKTKDNEPTKSLPFGNLFTRCLGLEAMQNGFKFQQNLEADTDFNTVPNKFKLTMNDQYVGYLIQHKFFWKDSIAADHGEHSHSLQWLVIARELNGQTTSMAHELYSRSVDYYRRDGRNLTTTLWETLVDCFPSIGGGAKVGSTTTDSYRSPNNVTRLLIGYGNDLNPINDHFLSHYLSTKYSKKSLVEITPTSQIKFKDLYTDDNTHTDWERGTEEFNKARLNRKKVTNTDPESFSKRTATSHTFHGKSGFLYTGS